MIWCTTCGALHKTPRCPACGAEYEVRDDAATHDRTARARLKTANDRDRVADGRDRAATARDDRARGHDLNGTGIETSEQRRIVQSLGIDRMQGYLIGRPTVELRPRTDRAGIAPA